MFREKICLILIVMVLGTSSLYAQQSTQEVCVDFRVGSMTLDSNYASNSERIAEIISFIQHIQQDSTLVLTEISFCGASSPEGSSQVNARLSKGRMQAIEKMVRQRVDVPDSLVTRNDHYIPWHSLAAMVEQSNLENRDEVLAILKEQGTQIDYVGDTQIDHRVKKLKALQNGTVWRKLNDRFFSKMRNACVVFVTYKKEPEPEPVVEPEPEPVVEPEPEPVVEPEPEPEPAPVVVAPEEPRHWYLKSNAIGWGMLIANVAAEVDLADHWSFALPVYYSAMNYFTSTVKFRTLCFQPEVRYWFSDENNGWFGGAHFGLAWFNYAKGGDWRYQDHHKNTPMLGGGLSGGYRKAISRDGRWLLEFSLGYGAYRLHYDIFHNEPNGRLVDTQKRTFYGIDHAAVTIAYRFDW